MKILLCAMMLTVSGMVLPNKVFGKIVSGASVAERYSVAKTVLYEKDHQEEDGIPKWIRSMTTGTEPVEMDADFSGILAEKPVPFIGCIGSGPDKLKIDFDKVLRRSNDLYDVIGGSLVGENLCHFHGTIRIVDNRAFIAPSYGLDDSMEGEFKMRGCSIGRYRFEEDPKEKGSGVFSGYMVFFWYQDNQGNVLYDDIEEYSDAYCNHQYAGKWQSYATKKSKPCAWGQYRIPNSGDLDVGAAEFSVKETYGDVWYYVKDPDGYCNLREKGNASARIIGRIDSGSFVEVLEAKGNWWRIKTEEGRIGYVHKSRIVKC